MSRRERHVELVTGFGPDRQKTPTALKGERITDTRRLYNGQIDLTGLVGGAGARNSPSGGTTIERGQDRQLDNVTDYVEARGATIIKTYPEEGVSASHTRQIRLPDGEVILRVVRPTFEQALRDLKDGVVDFLAWEELDRIVRDRRHGLDCIEAVVVSGRPIIDTYGHLDLSTDNGQEDFMRRVDAAATESRRKRQRTKASREDRAKRGYPSSVTRAFGWTKEKGPDGKQMFVPEEVELLREAIDLLLAPDSKVTVRDIADDWRERGIPTIGGNPWRGEVLRLCLMSPRMAGWSIYDKKVCLDWKGQPVVSRVYDGIVDPDTWDLLVEKITPSGPQARKRPEGAGRIYENSGLCVCELCGSGMYGNRFPTPKDPDAFRYTCGNDTTLRCGKVSIDGKKTDELIGQWVCDEHAEEAERSEVVEPWTGELELARLHQEKADLHDTIARGASAADVVMAMIPINTKIEALLNSRKEYQKAVRRRENAIVQLREQWPTMGRVRRRAFSDQTLERVIIKQSSRPSRLGFDRMRVVPVRRTKAAPEGLREAS